MKQFLLIALIALAFGCSSQTSRPYQCCPQVIEITVTGADLDSLYADSLLIFTPGAGKGFRLTKPPVIRSFHDNTMSFASGEYVGIVNEFGDGARGGYGDGLLSTFGDSFIAPYSGIAHGTFWHTYFMPYNGQVTPVIPHTCTGSVYLVSTFPITGGGPAAKLIVTIWYEEIAY